MSPPPYRLRCPRWLGLGLIAYALVVAPVLYALVLPRPAAAVLGVALGALVVGGVALVVWPRPIVHVDNAGLGFDKRRASWDEVNHLEVRDTILGTRLRAAVAARKAPRLFQPLVPASLATVIDAVQARRRVPVRRLPPTRIAPYRRLLFAALGVAVARTVVVVPIPGGVLSGPSSAVDVGGRLSGGPHRPGAVLVLPVRESAANLVGLARAALDDDVDVRWERPSVASRELAAPGGAEERSLAEQAAVAAGLACVGHAVASSGGELTVRSFRPVDASSGLLAPGDRLVAAGGRPVRYIEDLFAAAEGLRAGQRLLVEGRSPDGTVHTGALAVRDVDGASAPWGIGLDVSPIVLTPRPPVSLDLHGLSGPSAGLAGALGVVDAVGGRPLVGARRIGVTGTISPDGTVGPIADIRYKAATARRAGATLMVVPATQAAAARRHARSMTVVGVSTLAEAVTALGGAPCASSS